MTVRKCQRGKPKQLNVIRLQKGYQEFEFTPSATGTTSPEALLEHSLRFAPQTLRWLTANCLVAMFAET